MSVCLPLCATLALAAPAVIDPATITGLRQGDRIGLELLKNVSFDGVVHRRSSHAPGRVVVSGRLDHGPGGWFIIAANGAAVAGTVADGAGNAWRIGSAPGGGVLVERAPIRPLRACTIDGAGGLVQVPHGEGTVAGACDDGSVIDVLVVYTPAARDDAGGVAAIEAEIDVMVEFNNVAFDNSLVESTWNLVYVWELQFPFSPTLEQLTNPNDGVIDGVHALRDAYGADQVALIVAGPGGVANGLFNLDPESEATAFCINGRESAPVVLSHEIGHNLGCCHPLNTGGGCPPEGGLLFPYSNGHVFIGDSGMLWGTVMAGGNDLQHFSNPDVIFDGQPTGIEPGPKHVGADNALTINQSKLTVSNWRCNNGICEALGLPSTAPDDDGNGIPDACDQALSCPVDCVGNDGEVGVDEFLAVLGLWGGGHVNEPCDFDADGSIGITEFLTVLGAWGNCP